MERLAYYDSEAFVCIGRYARLYIHNKGVDGFYMVCACTMLEYFVHALIRTIASV